MLDVFITSLGALELSQQMTVALPLSAYMNDRGFYFARICSESKYVDFHTSSNFNTVIQNISRVTTIIFNASNARTLWEKSDLLGDRDNLVLGPKCL